MLTHSTRHDFAVPARERNRHSVERRDERGAQRFRFGKVAGERDHAAAEQVRAGLDS